MERIGLLNEIYESATSINFGRKGFAVVGKERAGRIAYEKGIAQAFAAFKEAQATADPKTIIVSEHAFLSQELQLCSENDKNSFNSLNLAVESCDEALLCLEVVENHSVYKQVEKCFSHRDKSRVKGFPKDAFHLACASHRTRLQNNLTATGVDPIEKLLIEQRRSNLITAQNSYIKKQKTALDACISL